MGLNVSLSLIMGPKGVWTTVISPNYMPTQINRHRVIVFSLTLAQALLPTPPTPHHPLKKLGIGYTFIQMVVCYLAELDHEYSLMAHFSHNAAVIKEEQANTPAVPGREY